MSKNPISRVIFLAALATLLLASCAALATPEPPIQPTEAGRMLLATTTSTYDSGLLDYLLSSFEQSTGIAVEVVAVGSGQAMEMGRSGDADALLVHSPTAEEEFVADGFGVDRESVMYNDFVIIGPQGDPAGISGMSDAAAALTQIAEAQAAFISRGDDSGTHAKEKSIWAAAEIEPQGDWYVSAGQGMGAVLTMAAELNAYTLTDRGTYLSRLAEGYTLPVLVEGDPLLFNPYHVIAVNPEVYPDINYDAATAFIEWIVSVETQEEIAAFTHPDTGEPLFYPDSEVWHEANP